ncbi:MAG: rhombotarget lipoprotein [Psychromonas sp.]|nr:rhombotarget lipoprotein [Psychromonas sp.]
MNKKLRYLNIWLLLALIGLLSACAGQQNRTKSSVVDYLYPKKSDIVVRPSIPVLHLPLKVGIAFVPEHSSATRGMNLWSGSVAGGALTESEKYNLLEKIAGNFRKYEFVSDIDVIPSAYLTAGGGFRNLEQIKTMYGIDVIALVSYDQVQFTDEGALSFSYWTLVGAYLISGEKNDTSTMLDTAVFDIQSRKMLFRAPGTSSIKSRSTPVNLSEELRNDSVNGFKEASKQMVENLDVQLNMFKDKVKNNSVKVKLVNKPGYSGGAFGLSDVIFMLFGLIVVRCKAYKRFNRIKKVSGVLALNHLRKSY